MAKSKGVQFYDWVLKNCKGFVGRRLSKEEEAKERARDGELKVMSYMLKILNQFLK